MYEANLTRLNEPSSGDKKKIVRRKGTKGLHELGHSWGYSEYLKDNILLDIKSLDEGSYSLADWRMSTKSVDSTTRLRKAEGYTPTRHHIVASQTGVCQQTVLTALTWHHIVRVILKSQFI